MTQDKKPAVAAQARYYAGYRAGSGPIRLYRLVAEMALNLAWQLVALQRRARERAQLAETDDATLNDVGLSRADLQTALKLQIGKIRQVVVPVA